MTANENSTPGLGVLREEAVADELTLLLKALRDPDAETRKAAAAQLAELGDNAAVKPLLGRLVFDRDPEVRLQAADALFRMNNPAIWDTIVVRLVADPEPRVRARLAELIGINGDPVLAPALVKVLGDTATNVLDRAADSLGLLKNPDVIPDLITGLRDYSALEDSRAGWQYEPQPKKRSPGHFKALIAMGPMVAEAVLMSTSSQFSAGQRVSGYDVGIAHYRLKSNRRASGEPSSWAAFYMDRVEILSEIGSRVISIIRSHIDSSQPESIRVLATRTLAKFEDPEARRLLCAIAWEDPSPVVRWLAVGGIKVKDNIDAVSCVTSVLQKDKEWRVRHRAAETLASAGAGIALEPLCAAALNDAVIEVRQAVIQALGRLKDARAIPTLGEIVWDAPDAKPRELAAVALGEITGPDTFDYLATALSSDDAPQVRSVAAVALTKADPERAGGVLLRCLERELEVADTDEVSAKIIWALGDVKHKPAVTLLSKLAEDVSYRTATHQMKHEAAKQALRALGVRS